LLFFTAKPSIQKDSLNAIYKIKEGDKLSILCPATGIPAPEVSWYLYTSDPISQEEQRRKNDFATFLSTP